MRALIWLCRRWTWLTTWRAKVVVGIFLLCLIPLPGVLAVYGRSVWLALALCPLVLFCGWFSGRLIGLAALQRGHERADTVVQGIIDANKSATMDRVV